MTRLLSSFLSRVLRAPQKQGVTSGESDILEQLPSHPVWQSGEWGRRSSVGAGWRENAGQAKERLQDGDLSATGGVGVSKQKGKSKARSSSCRVKGSKNS